MGDAFRCYIDNAIQWAETHLGNNAYAGRCLAFVEDAYERSNQIEVFGGSSAHESAEIYDARQNFGQPPTLGAFVFYDCFGTLFETYQNWGHVGLCIGEGRVIHAWNVVRVDNYLDVEKLTPAPGWIAPHYIGWTPVERIFQGYRKKTWNT
ncbi:MAG: C40 family peptidase [Anaerolineae bacterium]|nr:C40 family peptidase [Anaerolineae bacterium]